MNKLFYPAVFHQTEDEGFWVSFPDLPECLTEGDDMEKAYQMAVDALGIVLSHKEDCREEIPSASLPKDIVLNKGEYLFIVEFDMLEYKKRTASQAVKKTLSIPKWLNEAAMDKGLNFSAILQEALKEKLGIQ